jgi:hypothetical protein
MPGGLTSKSIDPSRDVRAGLRALERLETSNTATGTLNTRNFSNFAAVEEDGRHDRFYSQPSRNCNAITLTKNKGRKNGHGRSTAET